MHNDLSPEELERIRAVRKTARKLASKPFPKRKVRKLPQTVFIVPKVVTRHPVQEMRQTIYKKKPLVYIVLLGAVLFTYIQEVDADQVWDNAIQFKETVKFAKSTIQEAREFYCEKSKGSNFLIRVKTYRKECHHP